ncbi:phosphate/phosphite/phosphonate ABC transporter substrate-binding protein [Myceligenerans indicum]|uniref:Phosphate/phosphite/phosphonate ABC transporter substrate-binding protein n=1 Tax=Myceligenerans indicum TaxID=2593663 RepID=A0ABS1LFV8_9MICO|nr:phosphate/phosphite/phosphonate ABC transporter substrate-binding protein [Myceligenerans indicum]MBL0885117.1 phosphate/phosphite/phosphonate ABC transporter substrate-binding protein [Myceligenerans indicum]
MKRSASIAAATVAAALALSACGGSDEGSGSEERDLPETLTLGLVPSQDQDQLVEDAGVLGDLLGEQLGVTVEASVSTDYAALVVAMQTGQADIGMFGPIALVQAVDQAGAEAVLQSVRYGSSTYHTQWMTNDPDTYCLDDVMTETNDDGNELSYCNGAEAPEGPTGEDALALIEQGTTISFVDESSASGYYYPATQLAEVQGIDPLTDITSVFAGGHPNSVLNVVRGDAPIGTSYNDARLDVLEEEPDAGTKAVVFASSPEIPNDGVAVSGTFSDEASQKITDAFLALADSEEGLAALDAVYGIEGLEPADLDALDAARQVAANFGGE